ncbi:MAG: polyprenol monophosphomannose synthase [bacterium]|nr:polyprenol monophosphomannose synthase [bacterium]
MEKVLVIIPTYNERENIRDIVPIVLSKGENIDVLVVDDNSPDGTQEEVKLLMERYGERVNLLARPAKLGLGTAYVEGFKYALKKGYDLVVEMDADFSHNPEDLPRLIEAAKEADLVIGSRYTDGISVVNWPLKRLILSYFANVYARVVTGVPVKDLTAGFKCFRKKVLESIDLSKIHSDGYAFQIEMDYYAYEKGFRIKEVPIIFIERRSGTSKMSKRIIKEAFFLVLLLRLKKILKGLRKLFKKK